MFRIAVFILVLFAVALGFAWLADNPGSVSVQWDWINQGKLYEFSLTTLIVALAVTLMVMMILWRLISSVINFPKLFGRWRAGRRRDKGYAALSKGLVAAGAGNAPLAKKLAKESDKLLENEPLVAMLDAQTALLEGDRKQARKKFETMLGNEDTRLLGLRGLYVEAEQEGQMEAATHFAKEANTHTPGTPWATKAVLKMQTIGGEWEEAQRTLDLNRSSGVYDKTEFTRKKAVILTAQALEQEYIAPDKAKASALAAHKLAPGLVPAAVAAARISIRLNDTRKAGKVLEAAWKKEPHPEIADAYVNLSAGASAEDRLKRAEKLASKQSQHFESQIAVAKAAIDAGDFKKARKAMEVVLSERTTERSCLLMADIEEAEHGDRGRVREWLSRAVSAAKDPVWSADGIIADEWAPLSPVNGRLDAFEWKPPMEQLGATGKSIDYSQLVNLPLEDKAIELEEVSPIADEEKVVATTVAAAAAKISSTDTKSDEIDEAEVIEVLEEKSDDSSKPENDNNETESSPLKVVSSNDDGGESKESTKSEPVIDEAEADNSPYKTANLDTDEDGIIDRRPDDPGINGEEPAKKGWLF